MKPSLESLEGRSLLALIAVLGTGTVPVGPLAGHVEVGMNVVNPGQPGDVAIAGDGHDTATASIALQWNPTATILPIVIVDSNDIASMNAIASGIYDAVKAKATVINVSFATTPQSLLAGEEPALITALNIAERKGIPVVFAAGNAANDNDTSEVFPANSTLINKNVVSVAAVDKTGKLASFSNYGSLTVTVGALGVDVPYTSLSGATQLAEGTSFAAPMVSGLIGRIRDAMPHASIAKIQTVLKEMITVPNNYTIDGGAIL